MRYGPGVLILVRHAMPDARPDVPPHEWVLSDEGRAAAERLVAMLPDDAFLVASAEPKAWQTLQGERRDVVRDPRFNEVARNEPWDDDYRTRRRAYVDGAPHPGWEAPEEVAVRFAAGITERLAEAGERGLVVASHGMAIAMWLRLRVGLEQPGEFWSRMRFPDAYRVDIETGTIDELLS